MGTFEPNNEFSGIEPEDIIEKEVIEHEPVSNHWSAARRVILQILYEVDSADHLVGDVLNLQLARNEFEPKVARFIRTVVLGVLEHYREIDHVIQQLAPNWPLQQVALIDRNILRIAMFEIVFVERTPLKTAIDEAVRLAKIFGAEGSGRFVNGVLGTLVDDSDILKHLATLKTDYDGDDDEL